MEKSRSITVVEHIQVNDNNPIYCSITCNYLNLDKVACEKYYTANKKTEYLYWTAENQNVRCRQCVVDFGD